VWKKVCRKKLANGNVDVRVFNCWWLSYNFFDIYGRTEAEREGQLNTLALSDLVVMMVEQRASDLLLTSGSPPRFRIDGVFTPLEGVDILRPADTLRYARSILTDIQMERLESSRSCDTSSYVEEVARFRANVYYQRGSVAIAVRLIPFDVPEFEELGIPEIAKDFATRPHGLVLLSGPAGSGKSTTLAAMIEHINRNRNLHIVTIEDPIEYVHTHGTSVIDQREVGSDALSFSEALRSVFRQSPDVIMVGEMRDLETISLAITLAETGHLILGTLHTQDTTHAVSRIIDVFPTTQQQQIYTQLSMALQGVIAQLLLHRADGSGRVLACEVLNVNNAIRNLIRERQLQQIYSVIQSGRSEGMFTMNDSLLRLYQEGQIDQSTAVEHSPRPKELIKNLNRNM
jgi:twitching motility protein PilT